MSVEVELREQARRFSVEVGGLIIGRVSSYSNDTDEPEDEEYHAEKKTTGPESYSSLGWFKTLRLATKCVLDEKFEEAKVDKIHRMKA